MYVYYYNVKTPADAFEAASKDISRWSFAETIGLAQMADTIRDGFVPAKRPGTGKACFCDSGFFLLYGPDQQKGYGIAIVQLTGYESGISDPVAQEILDYHRVHRGRECFAAPLLTWSNNISSIDELDRGYRLLQQEQLLVQSTSMSEVVDESGVAIVRVNYFCR